MISPNTNKHPHTWTMHQFDLQSLLLFQYEKECYNINDTQAILSKYPTKMQWESMIQFIAKWVEFPMKEGAPCGEGGCTTWRVK
jgi:hypothetical protein